MAEINFRMVWEPGFENKAWHYRSSLNPLGDAVRQETDKIGRTARALAFAEALRADADYRAARGSLARGGFRSNKLRFFYCRALAHSLKRYAATIRFSMVHAGDQNYGMVSSRHMAGHKIEFGGSDPKYKLGDTGAILNYPAYGFLRRAVHGS
jgi:hypothetical protein